MIQLDEMNRDELIAVLQMKNTQIRNLEEELDAYRVLVEELQARLGTLPASENGYGD